MNPDMCYSTRIPNVLTPARAARSARPTKLIYVSCRDPVPTRVEFGHQTKCRGNPIHVRDA